MIGFGKRLVEARNKKGYTQKKLAEILGITASRLNYWEKDKREPDFFMFTKIIEVLDADANDLLGLKQYNISKKYNTLNTLGQQKADDYIADLSEQPKYIKNIVTVGRYYEPPVEIAAYGADETESSYTAPPEETT